jgi:hypothetical protein
LIEMLFALYSAKASVTSCRAGCKP